MKRILLFTLVLIFAFASSAYAIEAIRQKNVATIITFPIMKNDGTLITGAAGLDSEEDAWTDGAAPDGFTDCTNEATEIGSTGQYYLSLTQAEMNYQYIIIQVKSSTTGAVTQTMLIRTTIGAPANMATTDDGGTINVTGGAIDTVTTTTTATTTTTLTNAPGDSSGVTTLLSRLSSTRAGYLDNLNGLTLAGIADAAWDEAMSGHLTSGTTGAALNAAGSAGDPWSTSYPGTYASGTFGYTLKKIKQQADLIGH